MKRSVGRFVDAFVLRGLIYCLVALRISPRPAGKPKGGKPRKPERMLLIKLSAMGDSLMLTPIVRALRAAHPSSRIEMLVSGMNRDVFALNPHLDRVHLLELDDPLGLIRQVSRLRERRFDLVIDFEQRIALSALIAWAVCVGCSVGFKTRGGPRHLLYTRAVAHDPRSHEFDCMAALTAGYCPVVPAADRKMEVFFGEGDRDWARHFLAGHRLQERRFVIVHPGCGAAGLAGARAREWPADKFIELAGRLVKAGMPVVVSAGSDEERSLAERIVAIDPRRIQPVSGRTLGQFAFLLQQAACTVCADTGVQHLAAAVGSPCCVIFGPTDPLRCQPVSGRFRVIKAGLECMPCQVFGVDPPGCRSRVCMEAVSADRVFEEVMRLV